MLNIAANITLIRLTLAAEPLAVSMPLRRYATDEAAMPDAAGFRHMLSADIAAYARGCQLTYAAEAADEILLIHATDIIIARLLMLMMIQGADMIIQIC